MKDEFDKMIDELDLGEVDDFDLKPATYQVWMLGYDADRNITDLREKLFESKDPERAINFAEAYISGCDIENRAFPNNEKYVEVLVETAVDVDGVETNAGNLFDEYVEIEKI